jgi:hypothetical protein
VTSRSLSTVVMTAALIATCVAARAQQPKEAGPQPIARAQFIASMDGEFRKIDADKNGQLTLNEIDQVQNAKALAEAQARNKEWFVRLDANRNGSLSPAEFAKMVVAPVSNGQPLLARMDGNRDSQISLSEYRAATLANFDRLDSDKDGVVTPAEMKAGGITPR